MPGRNVIKHYIEGGHYHFYNRGTEKKKIFLEEADYSTLLNYLKNCLDPNLKNKPNGLINKRNVSEEVELIAYCLMPNHFHFLLKLDSKDGATKLLRHVLTSYAMYFNKKYGRQGSLFQGKPKGVLIETDSYLLHLTRYIHLNPIDLTRGVNNLKKYLYSSYQEYIGLRSNSWLKPQEILAYFKSANGQFGTNSYEHFVENYKKDPIEILGSLTLE